MYGDKHFVVTCDAACGNPHFYLCYAPTGPPDCSLGSRGGEPGGAYDVQLLRGETPQTGSQDTHTHTLDKPIRVRSHFIHPFPVTLICDTEDQSLRHPLEVLASKKGWILRIYHFFAPLLVDKIAALLFSINIQL